METQNGFLIPRGPGDAVSSRVAKCHSRPGVARQSGIALVLVLAFLVLITALVLAFFTSVTTELTSSKSYADGATTKQLADSAAQLVMGAIKQATSGTNPSGSAIAWASQPGMIRTYDNSGNPLNYYKLYSSGTMVVSAFPFDPSSDFDPNWQSEPALFTDINSPITSGTNVIFPIIDGNGIQSGSLNGSNVWTYSSSGSMQIQGFGVDPSKVNYTPPPAKPLSSTNTPVPMPVKWIYMLKDGTLTTPTGGDSTSGTWSSSGPNPVPKASNPIVGRIAFWTDDESCKVNINTASEGTYWDIPREYDSKNVNNQGPESKLASNAPMQCEYQRYPGHPATTSLSTIFGAFTTPEEIYSIVPRLGPGGSQEGTKSTTQGSKPQPPLLNNNRLYASLDELLFTPSRQFNDSAKITPEALDHAKFFVTTNSRSPDVNLFGEPRVCIWPINVSNDSSHRTGYDQLITFCSTVNSYPFYFQRQDPTDPTIDLPSVGSNSGLGRNRTVLEYLRKLTSQNIPGFGGNFADKYSTSNGNGGTDRDQILTEIFDYVRSTNLIDPNLSAPYAPAKQVGSNFVGAGQVIPIIDTTTSTKGFGRFRTVQGASMLFIANGDDQTNPRPPAQQPPKDVVTNSVPPPIGSGSVRVQACFLPQLFDPSIGSVFDNPNFTIEISGLDQFTLGGAPMGFSHTITLNQSGFSIDGAFWGDQFGLRQVASSSLVSAPLDLPKGTAAFSGGTVTIKLETPSSATNPATVIQTIALYFPPSSTLPLPTVFINPDLSLPITDPPLSGTSTATSGTTSAYVQDYKYLTVTSGTLDTSNGNYFNMRYFSHDAIISGTKYHGRINNSRLNGGSWILANDVIRSVSVAHGDVRLVAAQGNPPSFGKPGYPFAPVGSYSSSTAGVVGTHNWWDGAGRPFYGAVAGHLVQNANYDNKGSGNYNLTLNSISLNRTQGGTVTFCNTSDAPFNGVAVGKTTSYSSSDLPGDWDNGISDIRDGPFINKPDEGDMGNATNVPYNWKGITGNYTFTGTAGLFTPNRMIPSAVMFGSLPTGVYANRPWQTLLFHPDPTNIHPGNKDRKGDGTSSLGMPADHLLLDLFNMPVVEPYAISEPLSTAGRINMNYQIVPFTYITRSSGVQAVLNAEQVISIADSQATNYKIEYSANQTPIRYSVNMSETLKGFTARFSGTNGIAPDIFRSTSEICTLPIVPNDGVTTFSQLSNTSVSGNYWTSPTNGHRLTGDNSRERPYATIYPRLTTKSNTFTVHIRVQTLKKAAGTGVNTWNENKDVVLSEYRGSQVIERYVDADDPTIPDFADPTTKTPIDSFYKFRVLMTKKFSP